MSSSAEEMLVDDSEISNITASDEPVENVEATPENNSDENIETFPTHEDDVPTLPGTELFVVTSDEPSTSQNKPVIHTLQPKFYVPTIEETIDLGNYKPYVERFFTLRYCIDVNEKFNDHCVLIHSNKICVISLAPSHPLICSDIRIEKVDFQVSKNTNRMNNKVSGKRKRNAQNLNQTSPLCRVECADNKIYTIYSIVPGKLLEMNEALENEPGKIRECCPTFPHKQCYVGVVLPNIRHTVETLNKKFLTPEEYQKAIEERNNCKE